MTGHKKAEKVVVQPAAGVFDDANQVRRHQKELTHRRNVHHLRVYRDDHSGGGIQGAHGEKAELRRAINYNHVVVCVDFTYCSCHTSEEKLLGPTAAFHHKPWRLMLEFHEFEIPGYNTDTCEVGRTYNITHWDAFIVVPNSTVKRCILADIELWLQTKHR